MLNDDLPECPVCDGTPGLLGTLGTLDHWVCRHCGMQFSTPADLDETEYLLAQYEHHDDSHWRDHTP